MIGVYAENKARAFPFRASSRPSFGSKILSDGALLGLNLFTPPTVAYKYDAYFRLISIANLDTVYRLTFGVDTNGYSWSSNIDVSKSAQIMDRVTNGFINLIVGDISLIEDLEIPLYSTVNSAAGTGYLYPTTVASFTNPVQKITFLKETESPSIFSIPTADRGARKVQNDYIKAGKATLIKEVQNGKVNLKTGKRNTVTANAGINALDISPNNSCSSLSDATLKAILQINGLFPVPEHLNLISPANFVKVLDPPDHTVRVQINDPKLNQDPGGVINKEDFMSGNGWPGGDEYASYSSRTVSSVSSVSNSSQSRSSRSSESFNSESSRSFSSITNTSRSSESPSSTSSTGSSVSGGQSSSSSSRSSRSDISSASKSSRSSRSESSHTFDSIESLSSVSQSSISFGSFSTESNSTQSLSSPSFSTESSYLENSSKSSRTGSQSEPSFLSASSLSQSELSEDLSFQSVISQSSISSSSTEQNFSTSSFSSRSYLGSNSSKSIISFTSSTFSTASTRSSLSSGSSSALIKSTSSWSSGTSSFSTVSSNSSSSSTSSHSTRLINSTSSNSSITISYTSASSSDSTDSTSSTVERNSTSSDETNSSRSTLSSSSSIKQNSTSSTDSSSTLAEQSTSSRSSFTSSSTLLRNSTSSYTPSSRSSVTPTSISLTSRSSSSVTSTSQSDTSSTEISSSSTDSTFSDSSYLMFSTSSESTSSSTFENNTTSSSSTSSESSNTSSSTFYRSSFSTSSTSSTESSNTSSSSTYLEMSSSSESTNSELSLSTVSSFTSTSKTSSSSLSTYLENTTSESSSSSTYLRNSSPSTPSTSSSSTILINSTSSVSDRSSASSDTTSFSELSVKSASSHGSQSGRSPSSTSSSTTSGSDISISLNESSISWPPSEASGSSESSLTNSSYSSSSMLEWSTSTTSHSSSTYLENPSESSSSSSTLEKYSTSSFSTKSSLSSDSTVEIFSTSSRSELSDQTNSTHSASTKSSSSSSTILNNTSSNSSDSSSTYLENSSRSSASTSSSSTESSSSSSTLLIFSTSSKSTESHSSPSTLSTDSTSETVSSWGTETPFSDSTRSLQSTSSDTKSANSISTLSSHSSASTFLLKSSASTSSTSSKSTLEMFSTSSESSSSSTVLAFDTSGSTTSSNSSTSTQSTSSSSTYIGYTTSSRSSKSPLSPSSNSSSSTTRSSSSYSTVSSSSSSSSTSSSSTYELRSTSSSQLAFSTSSRSTVSTSSSSSDSTYLLLETSSTSSVSLRSNSSTSISSVSHVSDSSTEKQFSTSSKSSNTSSSSSSSSTSSTFFEKSTSSSFLEFSTSSWSSIQPFEYRYLDEEHGQIEVDWFIITQNDYYYFIPYIEQNSSNSSSDSSVTGSSISQLGSHSEPSSKSSTSHSSDSTLSDSSLSDSPSNSSPQTEGIYVDYELEAATVPVVQMFWDCEQTANYELKLVSGNKDDVVFFICEDSPYVFSRPKQRNEDLTFNSTQQFIYNGNKGTINDKIPFLGIAGRRYFFAAYARPHVYLPTEAAQYVIKFPQTKFPPMRYQIRPVPDIDIVTSSQSSSFIETSISTLVVRSTSSESSRSSLSSFVINSTSSRSTASTNSSASTDSSSTSSQSFLSFSSYSTSTTQAEKTSSSTSFTDVSVSSVTSRSDSSVSTSSSTRWKATSSATSPSSISPVSLSSVSSVTLSSASSISISDLSSSTPSSSTSSSITSTSSSSSTKLINSTSTTLTSYSDDISTDSSSTSSTSNSSSTRSSNSSTSSTDSTSSSTLNPRSTSSRSSTSSDSTSGSTSSSDSTYLNFESPSSDSTESSSESTRSTESSSSSNSSTDSTSSSSSTSTILVNSTSSTPSSNTSSSSTNSSSTSSTMSSESTSSNTSSSNTSSSSTVSSESTISSSTSSSLSTDSTSSSSSSTSSESSSSTSSGSSRSSPSTESSASSTSHSSTSVSSLSSTSTGSTASTLSTSSSSTSSSQSSTSSSSTIIARSTSSQSLSSTSSSVSSVSDSESSLSSSTSSTSSSPSTISPSSRSTFSSDSTDSTSSDSSSSISSSSSSSSSTVSSSSSSTIIINSTSSLSSTSQSSSHSTLSSNSSSTSSTYSSASSSSNSPSSFTPQTASSLSSRSTIELRSTSSRSSPSTSSTLSSSTYLENESASSSSRSTQSPSSQTSSVSSSTKSSVSSFSTRSTDSSDSSESDSSSTPQSETSESSISGVEVESSSTFLKSSFSSSNSSSSDSSSFLEISSTSSSSMGDDLPLILDLDALKEFGRWGNITATGGFADINIAQHANLTYYDKDNNLVNKGVLLTAQFEEGNTDGSRFLYVYGPESKVESLEIQIYEVWPGIIPGYPAPPPQSEKLVFGEMRQVGTGDPLTAEYAGVSGVHHTAVEVTAYHYNYIQSDSSSKVSEKSGLNISSVSSSSQSNAFLLKKFPFAWKPNIKYLIVMRPRMGYTPVPMDQLFHIFIGKSNFSFTANADDLVSTSSNGIHKSPSTGNVYELFYDYSSLGYLLQYAPSGYTGDGIPYVDYAFKAEVTDNVNLTFYNINSTSLLAQFFGRDSTFTQPENWMAHDSSYGVIPAYPSTAEASVAKFLSVKGYTYYIRVFNQVDLDSNIRAPFNTNTKLKVQNWATYVPGVINNRPSSSTALEKSSASSSSSSSTSTFIELASLSTFSSLSDLSTSSTVSESSFQTRSDWSDDSRSGIFQGDVQSRSDWSEPSHGTKSQSIEEVANLYDDYAYQGTMDFSSYYHSGEGTNPNNSKYGRYFDISYQWSDDSVDGYIHFRRQGYNYDYLEFEWYGQDYSYSMLEATTGSMFGYTDTTLSVNVYSYTYYYMRVWNYTDDGYGGGSYYSDNVEIWASVGSYYNNEYPWSSISSKSSPSGLEFEAFSTFSSRSTVSSEVIQSTSSATDVSSYDSDTTSSSLGSDVSTSSSSSKLERFIPLPEGYNILIRYAEDAAAKDSQGRNLVYVKWKCQQAGTYRLIVEYPFYSSQYHWPVAAVYPNTDFTGLIATGTINAWAPVLGGDPDSFTFSATGNTYYYIVLRPTDSSYNAGWFRIYMALSQSNRNYASSSSTSSSSTYKLFNSSRTTDTESSESSASSSFIEGSSRSTLAMESSVTSSSSRDRIYLLNGEEWRGRGSLYYGPRQNLNFYENRYTQDGQGRNEIWLGFTSPQTQIYYLFIDPALAGNNGVFLGGKPWWDVDILYYGTDYTFTALQGSPGTKWVYTASNPTYYNEFKKVYYAFTGTEGFTYWFKVRVSGENALSYNGLSAQFGITRSITTGSSVFNTNVTLWPTTVSDSSSTFRKNSSSDTSSSSTAEANSTSSTENVRSTSSNSSLSSFEINSTSSESISSNQGAARVQINNNIVTETLEYEVEFISRTVARINGVGQEYAHSGDGSYLYIPEHVSQRPSAFTGNKEMAFSYRIRILPEYNSIKGNDEALYEDGGTNIPCQFNLRSVDEPDDQEDYASLSSYSGFNIYGPDAFNWIFGKNVDRTNGGFAMSYWSALRSSFYIRSPFKFGYDGTPEYPLKVKVIVDYIWYEYSSASESSDTEELSDASVSSSTSVSSTSWSDSFSSNSSSSNSESYYGPQLIGYSATYAYWDTYEGTETYFDSELGVEVTRRYKTVSYTPAVDLDDLKLIHYLGYYMGPHNTKQVWFEIDGNTAVRTVGEDTIVYANQAGLKSSFPAGVPISIKFYIVALSSYTWPSYAWTNMQIYGVINDYRSHSSVTVSMTESTSSTLESSTSYTDDSSESYSASFEGYYSYDTSYYTLTLETDYDGEITEPEGDITRYKDLVYTPTADGDDLSVYFYGWNYPINNWSFGAPPSCRYYSNGGYINDNANCGVSVQNGVPITVRIYLTAPDASGFDGSSIDAQISRSVRSYRSWSSVSSGSVDTVTSRSAEYKVVNIIPAASSQEYNSVDICNNYNGSDNYGYGCSCYGNVYHRWYDFSIDTSNWDEVEFYVNAYYSPENSGDQCTIELEEINNYTTYSLISCSNGGQYGSTYLSIGTTQYLRLHVYVCNENDYFNCNISLDYNIHYIRNEQIEAEWQSFSSSNSSAYIDSTSSFTPSLLSESSLSSQSSISDIEATVSSRTTSSDTISSVSDQSLVYIVDDSSSSSVEHSSISSNYGFAHQYLNIRTPYDEDYVFIDKLDYVETGPTETKYIVRLRSHMGSGDMCGAMRYWARIESDAGWSSENQVGSFDVRVHYATGNSTDIDTYSRCGNSYYVDKSHFGDLSKPKGFSVDPNYGYTKASSIGRAQYTLINKRYDGVVVDNTNYWNRFRENQMHTVTVIFNSEYANINGDGFYLFMKNYE